MADLDRGAMINSYLEFRDYCKYLKGRDIRTPSGRSFFRVTVEDNSLFFIPSTNKRRRANPSFTEKVIRAVNESGSWSSSKYSRITYHSSYILGVLKQYVESGNLAGNDYCEFWGKDGWKKVSVVYALARPECIVRCIECKGAVRLHKAGPNGTPRAHAEHEVGHEGCSIGHYFNGVQSTHPQPVSNPNLKSELGPTSAIVYEDDESAFPEGGEYYKLHRSRERDGELPRRVKADRLALTGKLECEVCAFDFYKAYGVQGAGYIEAHHRIPIHKLDGIKKTKKEDLALVCSNCHRMLHRNEARYTVEELRELVVTHREHTFINS